MEHDFSGALLSCYAWRREPIVKIVPSFAALLAAIPLPKHGGIGPCAEGSGRYLLHDTWLEIQD